MKHLVFANDNSQSLVYVYDSVLEKVQNKIQLPSGSNPLHLYAVYYYDQVWVHNDGVGEFDVFRTAQVRYRSVAGVKASTTNVSLFDCSHLCRQHVYCSISIHRLDTENLWQRLIWEMLDSVQM